MVVETPEYTTKERRNGSKLRLSMKDYLKFLSTIVGAVVIIVTFSVSTNKDIEALAKNQGKNEEEIVKVKEENKKQNEDIVEIKTNVKHIKEDVQEIKMAQETHQKILYEILGEIRKDD